MGSYKAGAQTWHPASQASTLQLAENTLRFLPAARTALTIAMEQRLISGCIRSPAMPPPGSLLPPLGLSPSPVKGVLHPSAAQVWGAPGNGPAPGEPGQQPGGQVGDGVAQSRPQKPLCLPAPASSQIPPAPCPRQLPAARCPSSKHHEPLGDSCNGQGPLCSRTEAMRMWEPETLGPTRNHQPRDTKSQPRLAEAPSPPCRASQASESSQNSPHQLLIPAVTSPTGGQPWGTQETPASQG